MPIRSRQPGECFAKFEDHVRALVAAILPLTTHVSAIGEKGSTKRILSFRQGDPTTIALDTKHGRLHFYLYIELYARDRGKKLGSERYQLETHGYAFRLQEEAGTNADALIRWEYDRSLRHGSKRHVQFGGFKHHDHTWADLNRLHTPTGRVLLEHVLRFLIADLGVKPPCGDEWEAVLDEGERKFFEEFSKG
ncbi:MAG: hypothetical protein IT384_00460 [Deltaproteobacteria bacterium]|nr:hypothetical protein [Deltaproteobacteria bacterium]